MSSPYEILGLPPGASRREIARAYRRLARRCHPDVVSPAARASAHEQFIRVRAAHDELMRGGQLAPRPASEAAATAFPHRPAERERPWETLASRRVTEALEETEGQPLLIWILGLVCVAALIAGFIGARWAAGGQPVGARLASPSAQGLASPSAEGATPTESSAPNLIGDMWREGTRALGMSSKPAARTKGGAAR
jgi:hypothetical protein